MPALAAIEDGGKEFTKGVFGIERIRLVVGEFLLQRKCTGERFLVGTLDAGAGHCKGKAQRQCDQGDGKPLERLRHRLEVFVRHCYWYPTASGKQGEPETGGILGLRQA
jgi:hypothetical protein